MKSMNRLYGINIYTYTGFNNNEDVAQCGYKNNSDKGGKAENKVMYKIKRYIVAYDISDNKFRAMIEKKVSNYGFRLQKSVFECELSANQLEKLREDITAVVKSCAGLKTTADSIILFGSVPFRYELLLNEIKSGIENYLFI